MTNYKIIEKQVDIPKENDIEIVFPSTVPTYKVVTSTGVRANSNTLSHSDKIIGMTIAGISGGAIISGLISIYNTPNQILDTIYSINLKDMKDFNLNPFDYSGFLSGNKILNLLKKHLNYKFKDLDFNLNIIATEVETLNEKVFNNINTPNIYLYDSIRASMSISSVFKPHVIENKQYIDGGYVNNTAYDFFGENKDTFSIKIDVNKDKFFISNIFEASLIGQLASIKANEKKHLEDNKIGHSIIIKSKKDGLSFDFTKNEINLMINEGYYAVNEYLFKNKEALL